MNSWQMRRQSSTLSLRASAPSRRGLRSFTAWPPTRMRTVFRRPLASTVRPRKQLRAFDRVFVKAGETVPVTLKLGSDAFSLVNAAGDTVIERGDFILEVGASSRDIRLKETITY